MLLSEINSFDRVMLAMDKKRLMKDIQGHINSEEEARGHSEINERL
jgi:hypothetical protein